MLSDQDSPSEDAAPSAADGGHEPFPEATSSDVTNALHRVDRLLNEIRGAVDTAAREERHKPFSAWRWVGAVLQVFSAGLVALSVLDWAFGAASEVMLVKLAFASVLQLGALTAFVVSPRAR